MKRIIAVLAAGLSLLWLTPVYAQTSGTTKVVTTCGTASYTAGKPNYPTQDITGAACTSTGAAGGVVAGVTASASPTPVVAGTNKPMNEGLFSNLFTTLVDAGGVPIDFTATSPVNEAQINGVTPLMGNGVTGTGAQRVTIASDNSAVVGMGVGATGAAVIANTNYIGGNVAGNLTGMIACGNSIVYDASTNGKTQLVALSSTKVTYVCGYTIFSAGTVNVSFSSGTGTNCGSTSTNITPAFQLTAQTGAVDGSPFYRGLKTAASEELCIVTTAGVAVQAIVYYTQF